MLNIFNVKVVLSLGYFFQRLNVTLRSSIRANKATWDFTLMYLHMYGCSISVAVADPGFSKVITGVTDIEDGAGVEL